MLNNVLYLIPVLTAVLAAPSPTGTSTFPASAHTSSDKAADPMSPIHQGAPKVSKLPRPPPAHMSHLAKAANTPRLERQNAQMNFDN